MHPYRTSATFPFRNACGNYQTPPSGASPYHLRLLPFLATDSFYPFSWKKILLFPKRSDSPLQSANPKDLPPQRRPLRFLLPALPHSRTLSGWYPPQIPYLLHRLREFLLPAPFFHRILPPIPRGHPPALFPYRPRSTIPFSVVYHFSLRSPSNCDLIVFSAETTLS